MNCRDVADLRPLTDEHSATTLHHALAALGRQRGLDRIRQTDPAVRLHLLVSLHEQIRGQLLDTVLVAAIRDDLSRNELAVCSTSSKWSFALLEARAGVMSRPGERQMGLAGPA